jgi:hypothetical protein
MAKVDRRTFIAGMGVALGMAKAGFGETAQDSPLASHSSALDSQARPAIISVDHRYSPGDWQSTFCFPADPYKGLIGRSGELRYGHPGNSTQGPDYFRETVHFRLSGMNSPRVVSQSLEAPELPIIHTRIEQAQAFMELTTFATNEPGEGRVDNVLIEVRPKSPNSIHARVVVYIDTARPVKVDESGKTKLFRVGGDPAPLFMVSESQLAVSGFFGVGETGHGSLFEFAPEGTSADKPARYFLRFPQEEQSFDKIKDGLSNPEGLLARVRTYWHQWQPFHGDITWQLPSPYQEFLIACTRNIQQCRDREGNATVFHVGPTIYRNFANVDLNFILEAARYLGYDTEAQEALDVSWAAQTKEGGVFANGGPHHWKDTGIAAFTVVRQAELSQDWSYFRKMQPKIVQAFAFLSSLRERAKRENSANGRYGLLARGFGDGGLDEMRSEFTNTAWVLAGLKAVLEAADHQNLSGYEAGKQLYAELRQSFFAAVPQEMRQHPDGFEYLPMLMKEDPQWSAADEWDRPRPQVGQWALSHSIYPGLVFAKNDPVVKGHIALMQSCTQEEIPAETGWIPHEGLWGYNASFVAHVYLWAGLSDWANQTFHGFLNHASPLYCWREEQPLQESAVAHYVGDMPHNWASAEVIRYLRHMMALEDGTSLRLLAGIRAAQLASEQPWRIGGSPTKFGHVNMALESVRDGWQLTFERGSGPDPKDVRLPSTLGESYRFAAISAGTVRPSGEEIIVSPETRKWVATWKSVS